MLSDPGKVQNTQTSPSFKGSANHFIGLFQAFLFIIYSDDVLMVLILVASHLKFKCFINNILIEDDH